MATFRPIPAGITANSVFLNQGGRILKAVKTSSWGLLLLNGVATGLSYALSGSAKVVASGVILPNAAVLGWFSTTAGTVTNADVEGFSDATGRYGVTVTPVVGKPIILKFYANGTI